jgi:phage tail tape-measure protein
MSVPCLGLYCGWLLAAIWAPVLAGIALANASRAARSRVVLAAAVPPCVVLLLAAAAVLLPVFVTYTTRGGGGGAGGTDAALVGEEGGGTGDATPEPGPADGSPQPPVTQPGAPAPSP